MTDIHVVMVIIDIFPLPFLVENHQLAYRLDSFGGPLCVECRWSPFRSLGNCVAKIIERSLEDLFRNYSSSGTMVILW